MSIFTEADYTIVVPLKSIEAAQYAGDDDMLREVIEDHATTPDFDWDSYKRITTTYQPLQALVILDFYKNID